MKVRIGDYVYDADWQPIVLILSSEDKETIRRMPSECHKLFLLPRQRTPEQLDVMTASRAGGPPQTRKDKLRRFLS